MRYAADLDEAGDVIRVICIPGDVADAAAYCAGLGIAGEWRDAEGLPAIGQRYHEGAYYYHWRQIEGADTGPEGAESGYPEGAAVWHAGEPWVSSVANNVWEPGVSGWHRAGEAPPWTQPTGAHDSYGIGARVTHAGTTWESEVAANVWEPGVYGWVEVAA